MTRVETGKRVCDGPGQDFGKGMETENPRAKIFLHGIATHTENMFLAKIEHLK